MIIVDSSVVIDLLLRAEGSTSTELALISGDPLAAPDHMLVETARVLRRHHLRGEVDRETADVLVSDALGLGIRSHSCADLIPRAWELKNQFSLDDALYVALAEVLAGELLTSDRKLASQAGRFVKVSVPA